MPRSKQVYLSNLFAEFWVRCAQKDCQPRWSHVGSDNERLRAESILTELLKEHQGFDVMLSHDVALFRINDLTWTRKLFEAMRKQDKEDPACGCTDCGEPCGLADVDLIELPPKKAKKKAKRTKLIDSGEPQGRGYVDQD